MATALGNGYFSRQDTHTKNNWPCGNRLGCAVMIDLTKEEREFIYAIMNQVAVQGIGPNQLKVDVMRKMDVEPKKEEDKKK